jgi:recombination protein U
MPIKLEDLPIRYREQVTQKQLAELGETKGAGNSTSTEEMIRKHHRAAQSNAQGHYFEAEIIKACRWYSANGRAKVEKTPETFRVTQLLGGGRFEGRFIGKAQVDFSGTLSGGRSIMFDAKYTEKDRILQSALTKHQSEELEEAFSLGALCGVCVGMKGSSYFVTWEVWRRMKENYGRKYMTANDLKKFKLSFNVHSWALFLDYDKER